MVWCRRIDKQILFVERLLYLCEKMIFNQLKNYLLQKRDDVNFDYDTVCRRKERTFFFLVDKKKCHLRNLECYSTYIRNISLTNILHFLIRNIPIECKNLFEPHPNRILLRFRTILYHTIREWYEPHTLFIQLFIRLKKNTSVRKYVCTWYLTY